MVMIVARGRVGAWYFVHIYGRWNEKAGTKITPFKIINEGVGGLETTQRKNYIENNSHSPST